jgi:hypothetical protein
VGDFFLVMNGYDLSREFFAYKFENSNKIKANHTELYFYIIDLWNRLGQKKEFGLPTSVTMECLGIGSYNTYKKTLNDLIEIGFIKLISDSKNQHYSKVIAISNFDKALDKALDKATIKAVDKAPDKAVDSIDKQINNITNKQINNIYKQFAHLKISFDEFDKLLNLGYSEIEINEILEKIENYKKNTNYKSLFLTAKNWLKLEKEKSSAKKEKENEPIVIGRQTMSTVMQNLDTSGVYNPWIEDKNT